LTTEPRQVTPDLIGLPLADACTTAAWAGTSVDATHVTRAREPWGVVVAQSPAPGTSLSGLWRVRVLVSAPLQPGHQDPR
jgi:beta-lactam-binding protein with PASTA domain